MTTLLNCIAGGESITEIENNKQQSIDKLPLGFEFGTWEYPPYYEFFCFHGKIKQDLHNHTFTKEEKQRITKALREIITNWENLSPTEHTKLYNKILKNLPLNHRSCLACSPKETITHNTSTKPIVEHNPFSSHTLALIEKKFHNPLLFNKIEHYKKLLLIFQAKTTKIIN